jgi:hypothetical protein
VRFQECRTFRKSCCLTGLFLGLVAGGTAPLAGLVQDSAGKVTRVDVGYDLGMPGRTASLIVELSAPDGVRVGSTVNEIEFPTRWLLFEEVKADPLAQAEVTADLKSDPANKDSAVVHLTITAKQGAALSNGILATLVFKVSDDAKGPETVKLRNVARAFGASVPPSPIEPVAGKDGEIELIGLPPTAYACFFYMH